MSETLVYLLDNKVYINLTNRCTNKCIFCLRQDKSDVCGQEMWLDSENFTAQDVIEQLKPHIKNQSEITFCGYGEPTLKLEILKEVAKYIKDTNPQIKTRLNTNGHANFVWKRDVTPELKGLIDVISVSLNAPNSQEYDELSQPNFDGAYDEVKKFIKACTDMGIDTVATVVEGYKGRHINLEKCEQIANELGAKFRVREWIEGGY
ncbi:radical SAM protein [bacterium]|nr:radical SAM protein [bacterium]